MNKLLTILFFLCATLGYSARFDSPFNYYSYPFIKYSENNIQYFGQSKGFIRFYDKLDTLLRTGKGKINIVHIGGSHIQADMYSGRMREKFHQLNGGLNGGRGFVFPYYLAKTNAPFGYNFRVSGIWKSCRNVDRTLSCDLGVAGIAVHTADTLISATFFMDKQSNVKYDFNRLRLFYGGEGNTTTFKIDSSLMKKIVYSKPGYAEIFLTRYVDSITIVIENKLLPNGRFILYGMMPETDDNGIVYSNLGVNGASVPSFSRCALLKSQLALLQPDLVILGLGINDAYDKGFLQELYEANYDTLITAIREASPKTAILFTSNNDSYLYKRYVNKNGEKVRESMIRLALKHNAAFWDMYSVMGGLNSIRLWENNQLAQRDKVHFTRDGYYILGDLLFQAMVESLDKYRTKKQL